MTAVEETRQAKKPKPDDEASEKHLAQVRYHGRPLERESDVFMISS